MHLFETIEENLWPLQIILSPGGYHIDVRLRFRGSSGGCVLTCNFFRNPVGTHPSQLKLNPGRDRRVGRSAIGQCRKDRYGALTTPIAPHLAALVKQLETQKRESSLVA